MVGAPPGSQTQLKHLQWDSHCCWEDPGRSTIERGLLSAEQDYKDKFLYQDAWFGMRYVFLEQ